MSVYRVFSLNVGEGDCFILNHPKRTTVIDICKGNLQQQKVVEPRNSTLQQSIVEAMGNYNMCSKPTNPIAFMDSLGINDIWRFILTHPDMDHMDGIQNLFKKKVTNYWDCGVRRDKPEFKGVVKYQEYDYDFYENLIAQKVDGVNTIAPRAGQKAPFWNADDILGSGCGDQLHVVAPTNELIKLATESSDINDGCYVLVQETSGGNIVFAGDSNDATWEYIAKNHKTLVSNAAVLFAPHHGRKSGRDYSFLDIVNPRVTFFGYAPSEHLSYDAYLNRNLTHYTNNQCGNICLIPDGPKISVWIENRNFAKANNKVVQELSSGWCLLTIV